MRIINLYGAPSSGKSTIAAALFAYLKRHNILTELVGEVAKDLIYFGSEKQLANQVNIMGSQYRKLKDLENYGCAMAISDAPLLMQRNYCKGKSYEKEITPLLEKLNSEFDNIDVYVRRVSKYQAFGRVHTEEQSLVLAQEIWDSMAGTFHYVVDGNLDGADYLAHEVLKIADADMLKTLGLSVDIVNS